MRKALLIQTFIVLLTLFFTNSTCAQKVKSKKDLNNNVEVFFNDVESLVRDLNWKDYHPTLSSLNKAISYYNKNYDTCNASYFYALKGRFFYEEGKNDSALFSYIQSSKYSNHNCANSNNYYLYNSWSILYLSNKEYFLADSISKIALQEAILSENINLELNVLNNRAIILSNQKKYNEAIKIMTDIRKKAMLFNNQTHLITSLQNLGTFYTMKGNYDSALYYLDILEKQINDSTPVYVIMDYYNNLGVIYEEKKDFNKSAKYYSEAINLAKENQDVNALLVYLKNHSDILSLQELHQESRAVLKEYVSLNDSLLTLEKVQIMKELEKEYESSKQREQIALLEKDKLKDQLNLEVAGRTRDAIALILIVVIIISFALYRRLNYIRKSKQLVEKAKKRSEDLLLNILPEEVAEELKKTGKSEAKYHENVSVLFTDFVKFTEFTQLLSPKDLVNEIDTCFKAFDDIADKYNIEKIKTIGDSYMAAGGVPLPGKNTAENTIKAALEMQVYLKARFANRSEKGLPALNMRSGINSGKVVSGIVGVKKFQYDIWGDTVNTASRMESYGEHGKVNIAKTTYTLVKDNPSFKFISRSKIDVKGKGLIEMYYVSLA